MADAVGGVTVGVVSSTDDSKYESCVSSLKNRDMCEYKREKGRKRKRRLQLRVMFCNTG